MSSKSSKAKPTMRMVAERAQLSAATVSLALRGSHSIAPETRARVLAAARELNYLPAPRASRAAQAVGPHLLFMTKDFGDRPVTANPFYGEVLGAAERECATLGAKLTFVLLPEREAANEHTASLFASYKPDAILLAGAYSPARVAQVAAGAQVPCVLVDNVVPTLPCDSVMADDFGGGHSAARHLVECGHRRIAVIVDNFRIPSLAARYRGYAAACADAGIEAAQPFEVAWDRGALRRALEQILAQSPRPTAIFCGNDAYAVFVMELLRDLGLQVPHDMSVVGFDDLPIARMAHPPITTLHNHPEALGRIAVQRLLARLNGDDAPRLSITVATQLVVRASTRQL